MIKRPMKGQDCSDEDLDKLRFPLIASIKVDGIRSIKISGRSLTSALKPIPNNHIRNTLESILPDGADGEIEIVGGFQAVTSGVMSVEGTPDFKCWLFDLVDENNLKEPFMDRLNNLQKWVDQSSDKRFAVVPWKLIETQEELAEYYAKVLSEDAEGLMLRSLDGPYKCGKATLKEGFLLKRKPFKDSEAVIVGFVEQLHNTNAKEKNELGRSKRSSAKAGKVPAGTLGKFLTEDIHGLFPGVELKIGSGKGLSKELRQKIWDNRDDYLGKIIKYKYQAKGTVDAPRLPIYLGFRDERDITYD